MNNLMGKKLLILGGKPIGSCEIVLKAKQYGIYTIVTDYLSIKESPAKRIADEVWDISTADLERLVNKCKEDKVDGIVAGVHEYNLRQSFILCDKLGLPCYCTLNQWDLLENKENFKKECRKNGLPVAKDYTVEFDGDITLKSDSFPVVVKPSDGSGSRGFSVCYEVSELKTAINYAKKFSESESVLIEQYMDYVFSVIINYTIVDGNIYYSGISDKRSKKVFNNGAPIMSFQCYPSLHEREYLEELNFKVIKMLECLGLKNGALWIEAFYNADGFVFNELGYRFGGSLTYYPVQYLFGIDQLSLLLEHALTGKSTYTGGKTLAREEKYCILPIHVKAGIIDKIIGIEKLKTKDYFYQYVPVHYEGDLIQDWGSAQQVLAYIHFLTDDQKKASLIQKDIMDTLNVIGTNGECMLFNLFDEKCI